MISHLTRQLISLLISAMILISCIPIGILAETVDSVPPGIIPEASLPEETEPPVSEPEEPDPTESEPPESIPAETDPTEPSEPEPSEPEATEPTPIQDTPAEPDPSGPGLYFGLLHTHSDISDGNGHIEDLFQTAAADKTLDFLAVTDHCDSFDGHMSASLVSDASAVSSEWALGKASAAEVTSDSFAGIFGYEMSWPSQMKIGHISTFATPGFQSWMQKPFDRYSGALNAYYDALSTVSGAVGQFNHPGSQYGTFSNFAYSADADRNMHLIELDFRASDPCRYYTEALNKGWHLAPTGSRDGSDSARTAVYAQALTEDAILDALRSHQAYATEDSDLEIMYSMDSFPMGSQLKLRQVGDTMDVSVALRDPSETAAGLVELVTGSGTLTQQTLSDTQGTLSFALPAAEGYYYLKITQPDGDRAVTAPIWIDAAEYLGISGLTCDTPVPVQGEPLTLALKLYNQESSAFGVESLEVFADGIRVFSDSSLSNLPGKSAVSHDLTFSCDCVGTTVLTVKLSGTLDGCLRNFEAFLTVPFRQSRQVTSILADNSHGNAGHSSLGQLSRLAEENNIRFTAGSVTPDALRNCRFLFVTAPSVPFTDAFLETAAEFAGYGGSLVVCSQADLYDQTVHSAAELNRLLDAVGATLRFGDDTVQDPVNHSGTPTSLNSDIINTDHPLCYGISRDQVFRFADGCNVIPGRGTWLVKGRATTLSTDRDMDGAVCSPPGDTVLMAWESLSGGGSVIAAGCLFPDDCGLSSPSGLRDPGYANRTLLRNLLNIGGDPVPLSSIRDARSGKDGELFRIRGYVTAGTSNPYNTFPDTLYLQDETGGIAVTPFRESGIQIGTALEITGLSRSIGGNRVLKLTGWEILDTPMKLTQPETGSWKTLLNPDANGGTLVEVIGTCQEIYCREDNTLAGCLLKDSAGNLAKVQIDDGIFAGSDGRNILHKTIGKNRTVWAIGLLHVNENGESVIRARNCEEVVYVPPGTYFNPKTGSLLPILPGICMIISPLFLFLLDRKRRI